MYKTYCSKHTHGTNINCSIKVCDNLRSLLSQNLHGIATTSTDLVSI